jgi:hypothetical protein
MNDFKAITLDRKDLELALKAFDEKTERIHLGIEIDSINGDQILWVDNGKFGNDRDYIIINKPWKE